MRKISYPCRERPCSHHLSVTLTRGAGLSCIIASCSTTSNDRLTRVVEHNVVPTHHQLKASRGHWRLRRWRAPNVSAVRMKSYSSMSYRGNFSLKGGKIQVTSSLFSSFALLLLPFSPPHPGLHKHESSATPPPYFSQVPPVVRKGLWRSAYWAMRHDNRADTKPG